jgi:hypothetical protein
MLRGQLLVGARTLSRIKYSFIAALFDERAANQATARLFLHERISGQQGLMRGGAVRHQDVRH